MSLRPLARRIALVAVVVAGLAAIGCTSDSDAEDEATAAATETSTATTNATTATTATEVTPAIEVEGAWARATPGNPDENSAAYALIHNRQQVADHLVGVSTVENIARSVETHTTMMEGDTMKMVEVDGWDIPAGGTLELKRGGDHVMFIGLDHQLVPGETFTLVFEFEQAGTVELLVEVKDAPEASMGGGAMGTATAMPGGGMSGQ